jgi:hypothetical protein
VDPSSLSWAGQSSGKSTLLSSVSALNSAGCRPWQIAVTIEGAVKASRDNRST